MVLIYISANILIDFRICSVRNFTFCTVSILHSIIFNKIRLYHNCACCFFLKCLEEKLTLGISVVSATVSHLHEKSSQPPDLKTDV